MVLSDFAAAFAENLSCPVEEVLVQGEANLFSQDDNSSSYHSSATFWLSHRYLLNDQVLLK